MRYETNPADPGILFEIYFPKKIKYQSAIYETLKKGDDYEHVRNCLLTHRDDISLLFPPKLRSRLNVRCEYWKQVYFGFSIYEVDGAFFDREKVYEDRTQVIRLILHPHYKDILKDVGEKFGEEFNEDVMEHVRQFRKLPMSLSSNSVEKYLTFYFDERNDDAQKWSLDKQNEKREKRNIIEGALKKMAVWIEDSYVFIFGYVIGQLTSISEIDEKEIWVTSYRSAVINRITQIV